MARDSTETRAALLEAGRHLFATEGIYSTPLSSIIKLAGQRNSSALQYHFAQGGIEARQGLLFAIIHENNLSVEMTRQRMLDEVVKQDRIKDLTALVRVAAIPLSHKLFDPAGRQFLAIISQMVDHFNNWDVGGPRMPSGALITFRFIEQALPKELPPLVRRERVVRFLQMTTEAMGSRARYIDAVQGQPTETEPIDTFAFISNFLYMAIGALQAPALSVLSEQDLDPR